MGNRNSAHLCYETILPGLGFNNYSLSIFYICLSILNVYTFISPNIVDLSFWVSLIIFIIYAINLSMKYSSFTDVDNKIKELIFAMIIPGLDIFIYKSRILGIIVISFFVFCVSVNNFMGIAFTIAYLFLYHKIFKQKWLAISLIVFTLLVDVPITYFKYIKNNPIRIISGSMSPTLKVGEEYLASITEEIKVGDIGVFEPNDAYPNTFVKRIVGLEGDEINISDGRLYINNIEVKKIKYSEKGNLTGGEKIIIPKNKVYVLGDNTNNSYDSREFGMIDRQYLYGKIIKGLGSRNVLTDDWNSNNILK